MRKTLYTIILYPCWNLQGINVNALYDFGLLRIDDELSVLALGVAEEAVVIDGDLSLLVAVLQTELYILRKALAFLLGKARYDCDQHLALSIHRVDGFFFKINRDVLILELPYIL